MKTVGHRQPAALQLDASGDLLMEGARFNEALQRLRPMAFVPKGVYRFKTHEEANLHWQECVAAAMAKLASASK